MQLLHSQIPKVQKDTHDLTGIFPLLGSERVKAEPKMLVKLTPGNRFQVILVGGCTVHQREDVQKVIGGDETLVIEIVHVEDNWKSEIFGSF